MNEHDARTRLSSIGLDDEMIEEVLPLVARPAEPTVDTGGLLATRRFELDTQMDQEPDWRKRAALAARKISLSTEEGY